MPTPIPTSTSAPNPMISATLEFDDDDETKAWLVEKISAALEQAEEAGYKRAMAKRF